MTRAAVNERPILCGGPVVRAILAGARTQMRRAIYPQPRENEKRPGEWWRTRGRSGVSESNIELHVTEDKASGRVLSEQRVVVPVAQWLAKHCPLGVPGDRLWVRESFGYVVGAGKRLVYRADGVPLDRFRETPIDGMEWSPGIFMARGASRLTLEITSVRAERLQDITQGDARAEGYGSLFGAGMFSRAFDSWWDDPTKYGGAGNLGRASWASNPWVWAISFTVVPK